MIGDLCRALEIGPGEYRSLVALKVFPPATQGRGLSLDFKEAAALYVAHLRERLSDAETRAALGRLDQRDELALALKNALFNRDPAKHCWTATTVEMQWVRIVKAVATAMFRIPDLLPTIVPDVSLREREAIRGLIERELGEIVRPSRLPSIYRSHSAE